jgi:hypothetical protein
MSGLFLFMLPVHLHNHIEGLAVGNFKLTILPSAVRYQKVEKSPFLTGFLFLKQFMGTRGRVGRPLRQ